MQKARCGYSCEPSSTFFRSSLGLEPFEQGVHHVIDLIMRERGVMRRFLSDGPIRQPVWFALDEVKDKGTLAESYVLEADFGWSVAPSLPASEGPAHQPGICARINALHRYIASPHREVIIHQEIRRLWIAHLRQSLGGQLPFDRRAKFLPGRVIRGIGFRRDRLAACNHVARNHRPLVPRFSPVSRRPPRPSLMFQNRNIPVTNNPYIFVATCEQQPTSQNRCTQ